MMGGLLSGLKPWLLGAVAAVVVGALVYVTHLQGALDDSRTQQATTQAALDMTATSLAFQVERNELLVQALEEREQELNQGAQRIDQLRAQASALGADDADSNEWTNQRVPSGVHRWLRDLAAPGAAGSGASVVPD